MIPVPTATTVATIPGIMNEWFSTYFPIFVVPLRSKFTAAISVPYVGIKKYPFTAGNIPASTAGGIPIAIPSGINVCAVAA